MRSSGVSSATVTAAIANVGVVEDAATNTNTDVLILDHRTTGTAAAGFSTGLLFRGETSTGTPFDIARISANEATATAGSEKGGLDFWVRTGGAVLSKKWALSGGGSWALDADNAYSLASNSLRLASSNCVSFRVHAAAGDVNRSAELSTFGLGLGMGGATAMDWFLAHSATAMRSDMATGNILGAVGVGGYACRTNGADVNPTSSLIGAELLMGAGGASAPDIRVKRTGTKTLTFDDGTGGALTVVGLAAGSASHMPSDLVTVLASGTAKQYERHARAPSVVQLAARGFQTQADSKVNPPQTWGLANSGVLASASVSGEVLTLNGASSDYDCYGVTDTGPRLTRTVAIPRDYEFVARIGLAVSPATATHRVDVGLYYLSARRPHVVADLVCVSGVWTLRCLNGDTGIANLATPTTAEALAGIWVRLRLSQGYTWTMDYDLSGSATEPTTGWVTGAAGSVGTVGRQSSLIEHVSITRSAAGAPVATIFGVRTNASAVDVVGGGPGLAGEGYAAAPAALLLADIDAGSGSTFAPAQAALRLRLADAINRLPGDAGTWTFSCVSSASAAPAAGAYTAAASVVTPASARYVRLYALCVSTSGTQPASLDLSRLVLT